MRFPGQPVLAGSEQMHKPHNAESHPPRPTGFFPCRKGNCLPLSRSAFSQTATPGQWLGPSMRAHTGSGEPSMPVGLGETLAELGTKATMRAEGAPTAPPPSQAEHLEPFPG